MLIKRYLLDEIIAHLPKKEITLIVGPRQAGKTTLMSVVQEHLKAKGEMTLFLNLDFDKDLPHFRSQTALLDRIRLEFGSKKGFLFIDEIQRKENAGLFLKGLYDTQTSCKFIVLGSGSIELKEKIHESLLGRKRLFELNTVSLREFVNHRTGYRYEDRLSRYFQIERSSAMSHFLEYMNFGGYPRVILEETIYEKRRIIDEIYRSYIEKDISFLLRVERIDAFREMLRLLASQMGSMVNLNNLSAAIGISIQTIKNYLAYAEKTFVIRRVTPFFRNVRKEIIKSPVAYFYDLGFRNYSIGQFGMLTTPSQMGFLFQNLVLRILDEMYNSNGISIHYWRTKDRAEVDFVIDRKNKIIPVEVKCIALKEPRVGRSMRSFIKRYSPEEAWLINLHLQADLKIEKTLVRFMPYFDLLEERLLGER